MLILSHFKRPAAMLILLTLCICASAQEGYPEIYRARRAMAIMKTGNGAVLIPGTIRTPYGQADASSSKYFEYLTGWNRSGSWMIIEPGLEPGCTLFVTLPFGPEMTPERMSAMLDETKTLTGADTVCTLQSFERMAGEILSGYDTVWTIPVSKLINEKTGALFSGEKRPVVMDIRKILNDLRVVKDTFEIRLLTRAAEVTAEAQRRAMMLAAPGRWEYELEAAIEHTYRSLGCDGPGFTTIIGSGPNSTILHYDINERRLEEGDVIVMDIGAAYKGYTADVTRTIPASGRFTPEQLEIYNIVLEAEKEAIKEMVPGNRSLSAHDRATEIIMEGLHELGLVTDPASHWQKSLYILYTCTHHIGLDVHDTYPFQLTPLDEATFKPGMVITIEPGIYISKGMLDALTNQYNGKPEEEEVKAFVAQVGPLIKKYENTGVRIEDDILITAGGNINLSEAAPKEPKDIMRLMKKRSRYD